MVPPAPPVLPTFSVLPLPAEPRKILPRMRPLLLIMTPPVVPTDRSMALVIDEAAAPVPGVRTVLLAWMVPALLMVFRLPL